jgi:hypothetical protein
MPPVASVAKECTATGLPGSAERPLGTMENTAFTTPGFRGTSESAPRGVGSKTKSPVRGRPPGGVLNPTPRWRLSTPAPKSQKQSQTSQPRDLTGPAPSGMHPSRYFPGVAVVEVAGGVARSHRGSGCCCFVRLLPPARGLLAWPTVVRRCSVGIVAAALVLLHIDYGRTT